MIIKQSHATSGDHPIVNPSTHQLTPQQLHWTSTRVSIRFLTR